MGTGSHEVAVNLFGLSLDVSTCPMIKADLPASGELVQERAKFPENTREDGGGYGWGWPS